MSATTTSVYFPLATEQPFTGKDDNPGGNAAGASGKSTGGVEISQGAMIAIIVVVCVVGVIGIATSVLFYLAKKREWKVRETIRKSARKVVTALTPRRSEFPKSVKDGVGPRRDGRLRLDDVPPTPRLKPEDLEKGLGKGPAKGQGKKKPDLKRTNFSRK